MLALYGIRRMGFLLLGGPGETPLAHRAVQDGMISGEGDPVFPRFYLARGLEPWIHQRVARFESSA